MGKFDLDIGNSDGELLQALVDTSHISEAAALEIAQALGVRIRITT